MDVFTFILVTFKVHLYLYHPTVLCCKVFPSFKKSSYYVKKYLFFFLFSEIATFQVLYDAPNNQEEKKKLERNSLFFTIVNQIVNSSGSDSKLMTHEALRCEQVNGQVGPAVGK